jgi:hypothetical protein
MSAISLQGNASGTGTLTVAAPSTNTNRTLTLPDGTGTFTVAGVNSNIVAGTAVASTTGTSIDFTGIPTWVKRITVMFNGVSGSGTSNFLIQLGSGSITSSGYVSCAVQTSVANTTVTSTAGFIVTGAVAAAQTYSGITIFTNISGNNWISLGTLSQNNGALNYSGGNSPALASVLDRVRITTVNGTDTFDAGSINILYE